MPDSVAPVNAPQPPTGWFPDPVRRYEYRYYNGISWTADVSTNGHRAVDPMGAPTWDASWVTAAPGATGFAKPRPPGRGMGIASFVIGLVSLLASWLPFVFVVAGIGALVGLVLGVKAYRTTRRAGAEQSSGSAYALTGAILSAVALPMCAVGVLLTGSMVRTLNTYLDPGRHEVTIDQCDIEASSIESNPNISVVLPRRVDLTGTIRNLETTRRSYTIFVAYRAGSTTLDTDTIVVKDVAPAGSAAFEGTSFVTTAGAVSCVVTDVLGPTPFGQPAEVAATQASYIRE